MIETIRSESAAPETRDIIWLHGAGLSGSTWCADIDGIKPDLPGHGTAPCIPDPSVEHYADTIEPLLPDRFALVGHSLGGMVALELAARHPARVRGLILAEAVPTVRQSAGSMLVARIGRAIMGRLNPATLAWLSGLSETGPVKQHLRTQIGAMTTRGIRDGLDAAMAYDGRPHLSGIKAPALIMVGQRSRATHAGAKLARDAIADAQWLALPGGHMIHIENADLFYSAIFAFLKDKK